MRSRSARRHELRATLVACLTSVVTLLGSAKAAHATDPATAQALFDQGRKLMAQQQWAEACPKLEESQRLDPAGGTLLHLALCREHEGRIATAWALYQDALSQAKHDARKDRAKIAKERIDALVPRLPQLRVRVALPNRSIDGFTLSRDGVAVGAAQWGEQLPADPGPHVLAATAPGRRGWSAKIDVPARAQETVVEVPELEIETTANEPSKVDGLVAPVRAEERGRGDGQRIAGVVVGGVGIAGVVVGSIFGLIAISKSSEADEECAPPDRTLCSAKGVEAGDAQKSAGNVSTLAFIAGGVLVAGGAVLYFTAPSGSTVALRPSVTPQGASLGLSTSF